MAELVGTLSGIGDGAAGEGMGEARRALWLSVSLAVTQTTLQGEGQ